MQSSQNRGDMITSRSLYRKLPVRARVLVAASRDFRRMLHGERSYSSRDGSDHQICPHARGLLVNTSTYMKALTVEMNRLTYIIHVTVEVKLICRRE